MAHFAIRTPMWNGGKRVVGLADTRVTPGINTIEITAVSKKDGERFYPKTYKMDGAKIRQFPVKSFPNIPMPLRMVPINELEEN